MQAYDVLGIGGYTNQVGEDVGSRGRATTWTKTLLQNFNPCVDANADTNTDADADAAASGIDIFLTLLSPGKEQHQILINRLANLAIPRSRPCLITPGRANNHMTTERPLVSCLVFYVPGLVSGYFSDSLSYHPLLNFSSWKKYCILAHRLSSGECASPYLAQRTFLNLLSLNVNHVSE